MPLTRMQNLQSVQSTELLTAVKPGTNVTILADGTVQIPLQSGLGSRLPEGTTMIFFNPTAPVGWTRQTGSQYNDSMIRVVAINGGPSSGSVPFSTIFSATSSFLTSTTFTSGQVASYSLTTSTLAAHTHGILAIVGRDQKGENGGTGKRIDPPTNVTTTSTGGNSGHSHSLTGQPASGQFIADFNVKYVTAITCRFDG